MNSAEFQSIQKDEKLGLNIIQCKTCRTIVGDTSTLHLHNRETFLITVHSIKDKNDN